MDEFSVGDYVKFSPDCDIDTFVSWAQKFVTSGETYRVTYVNNWSVQISDMNGTPVADADGEPGSWNAKRFIPASRCSITAEDILYN